MNIGHFPYSLASLLFLGALVSGCGGSAEDPAAGPGADAIDSTAEADRSAIAQLQIAGGDQALLVRVPLLRDDVHDVGRLVALERYLFA